MEKKHWDILLVDDEKDLLSLVGDYLRAQGYNIITALDAGRAMTQLDENEVRLIILDINLAGEDGVQLMTFLKANHPDTAVILYTGLSHEDSQVKVMLRKGATCYVNKGQPLAELLFAIQTILAGKDKPA